MSAKKGRRTTQRSSKGTKLYEVRDAKRAFKDIQQYARAHGRDLARVSKSEAQAAAEKATKAMHQAEAAFQGAVHRVEEMIQIGRRELANVREAAKDALARLLASTQRGAHVAADEAQAMARKVGSAARGRKARASAKSAKAAATVTARKKPGGKARAAKRGRKG